MKKVQVQYHKDGDSLVLIEEPWWITPYEWFANRFCPCCGISGWLSGKSNHVEEFYYIIWNGLLDVVWRNQKEVYSTPIESGCKASIALWGTENHLCWNDDCECKEEEMPDL